MMLEPGSTMKNAGLRSRSGLLAAIVLAILTLWIVVVTARGTLLSAQVFDVPLAGEAPRNFSTPGMIWLALVIGLICASTAVAARAVRAEATLPATLAASGAILFACAVVTGSLAALATVASGFVIAWLAGSVVLHRLPLPPSTGIPLISFPVAIALGLGLLGSTFFFLAALHALNAWTVLGAIAITLLAALAVGRDALRASVDGWRSCRPEAPTWFETIVLGLTSGLVSFALLTAFVPEIQTDATREHLPIAREIWQTGSVSAFSPMDVSRDPVQGHIFYAVAYGFGGSTAATLVQTIAGLTAIAGVAAIAWLVAGRAAAWAGAAIFATMPIVLWQFGHAFMDLFPVLFMVTAAICVLLWQRNAALSWLVAAGALAGIGFACKVTMGWSIVGLLAGIVLAGRAPWRWRDRVLSAAAFALGLLVILPWLARGYVLTGSITGAGFLLTLLDRVVPGLSASLQSSSPPRAPYLLDTASQGAAVAYLDQRGLGHAPIDMLRAPWTLTFHGDQFRFPLLGRGEIGISLLMLLPLALLGPRNRATAFLAITAFVSYAIWFLTPHQIARHLLPTLAIASALAGIGVASAIASATTRPQRVLSFVARAGLIAGCLAVPLLVLPNQRATLPVGYLLDQQSADEFLGQNVPSADVLLVSSTLLPPDTPLAYIGGIWEGPQIYSEARLIYLAPEHLGTAADEILANLDQLGISNVIWNRNDAFPADWRSPLLSSGFLENHARILAGDDNAYLFEVLAEPAHRWGSGMPGNLVVDPEFATVRNDASPWSINDRASVDNGVLTLKRRAAISQRVPVSGGTPYLLTASGACVDPGDQIDLSLEWQSADGTVLDSSVERVLPGAEHGSQFIWRRAPEDADAVTITVAVTGSASCRFDEIGLREAP